MCELFQSMLLSNVLDFVSLLSLQTQTFAVAVYMAISTENLNTTLLFPSLTFIYTHTLQASAIILSLAPLVRPYWGMGGAFFFVSMFMMYSVGYPIGHTTLIGLFSKVIGKKPQV